LEHIAQHERKYANKKKRTLLLEDDEFIEKDITSII